MTINILELVHQGEIDIASDYCEQYDLELPLFTNTMTTDISGVPIRAGRRLPFT